MPRPGSWHPCQDHTAGAERGGPLQRGAIDRRRCGDPAQRHVDRRGIAPRLGRLVGEEPEGDGETVAAQPERQPSIPAPGGAADGGRARAAHLDRHAPGPKGPGERLHAVEGVVAPSERCTARGVTPPQGADGVDRLVRPVPAAREVDAARLDLLAQPAQSDAEPQTTARKPVDRGGALGQHQGTVHRQHEQARGQAETVGDAGHIGQCVERIGDHAVVREGDPSRFRVGVAAGVVDGEDDMLGQHDRLDTQVLRFPGEGRDPVGIREVGGADRRDHRQCRHGRRGWTRRVCGGHDRTSWPRITPRVGPHHGAGHGAGGRAARSERDGRTT